MLNKNPKDPMVGWKWWQEAWYDTRGARVEFFVVGLLCAVAALIAGRLPFFRSIAAHALAPFLQFAAFEFTRNWREKKARDFMVLLRPFKDQVLFKKLLPLSIAGAVFGLGHLSCDWLANRSLSFGALRFVLAALESSILILAVPLVGFKNYSPLAALKMSLNLIIENAGTFLVFYGVGALSVLAGLCSLGIGFLFLLPLYVYLPFLVFKRLQPD